jgi:hypothetical protein
MEIVGQIIFKDEEKIINEKFKKREFVIQTNEQYPQELLIELHNDKTNLLRDWRQDDWVKVSVNLRGRGFMDKNNNQRWNNQLVCWKIEK